jgi:MYND finger
MITIVDYCVTSIPEELESNLRLQPFCAACEKSGSRLRKCSGCELVYYCSTECQRNDWPRHKHDDKCISIKKMRRAVQKAATKIRSNRLKIIAGFYGRYETDVFELVAGRFLGDPLTLEYMVARMTLYAAVTKATEHQQTICLWEEVLTDAIDVKRLTHLYLPDMVDHYIPDLLVKLHPDDDAVTFIRHWRDWRDRRNHPHLVGFPSILELRKGE